MAKIEVMYVETYGNKAPHGAYVDVDDITKYREIIHNSGTMFSTVEVESLGKAGKDDIGFQKMEDGSFRVWFPMGIRIIADTEGNETSKRTVYEWLPVMNRLAAMFWVSSGAVKELQRFPELANEAAIFLARFPPNRTGMELPTDFEQFRMRSR